MNSRAPIRREPVVLLASLLLVCSLIACGGSLDSSSTTRGHSSDTGSRPAPVPTARPTSVPPTPQPILDSVVNLGHLRNNLDSLTRTWDLQQLDSGDAWVNWRSGFAQISLNVFDEGYVIGTYVYDGQNYEAVEYVQDFQIDAIDAVLPNGPIEEKIWEFIVESWDHFWNDSPNTSEYYSGEIRGRKVYYEISFDDDGGIKEFIGVGMFVE